MTTIAFRDGILAADTLATWNGSRDGFVTKIAKRGPVMAAVSGCAARGRAFLDWFAGGMVGHPPSVGISDSDRYAHGFVFPGGDRVLTLNLDGWESSRYPFFSAGSGGDYAAGAMQMGATAEEAVRAAMVWDIHTGGDVTVLRAAPQQRKQQP